VRVYDSLWSTLADTDQATGIRRTPSERTAIVLKAARLLEGRSEPIRPIPDPAVATADYLEWQTARELLAACAFP
jgi:hypothetical protein